MNIYLENAGFFSNFHRLNRCCRHFGTKDPVHFHLICRKGISPFHMYLLSTNNRAIATLTVHIPVRHLTRSLIALCNSSRFQNCLLLVDHALTERQWNRICKLNGIIRIVDTSSAPNETFYSKNRCAIYKKGNVNTIRLADIYHLTTAQKSVYQCHYSSCLGKTLLISRDGSVSFCPQHAQESLLGTVDNLDGIFEAPTFYEALSRTVEKRNACKATCPHFEKCKGGCPFENDCAVFLRDFEAAIQDRNSIIAAGTDLSTLPLYKELAVLRHLCNVSAPQ